MCGIFAVTSDPKNQAAQTVLDGLKKLEYRGYDSWGIGLKNNNTVQIEKHIGKIGSAKTTLPSGSLAIGHTRWATHGGVTDANAHPHLDCTKAISVIHNGIVENYQELKTELVKNGHTFSSETDTEVIAHLIEEERKNKDLLQAVITSFKRLIGSNAITVLDAKSASIVACRDGSPLVIGYANSSIYLASDATALLTHTNKVHFMHDGEAALLHQTTVEVYDIVSEQKKEVVPQVLDWKAQEIEKDGHPHFLIKEILEQSQTIPFALSQPKKNMVPLLEKLKSTNKVAMVGCGSAYFCGLLASYYFAASGIETRTFGAYEFEPFCAFLDKKSILIAISQSGETADTLLAIKAAKKRGVTIVAVVNAKGSTLERLSDFVLPMNVGPEIAVVSTKAFTAQLATMLALSRDIPDANLKDFKSQLTTWIHSNKLSESVLDLSKKMLNDEHVYVIGKHEMYPAAHEFALKLKETSYIHAEAFSSGELKHGVIALIQKNTPCIVLTSDTPILKEVISSAIELKSRGAFIIGVGPIHNEAFDYWIETPQTDASYTVFYNVLVGQLLGYYLSIGRGADPDKPRNLAKSVTVK